MLKKLSIYCQVVVWLLAAIAASMTVYHLWLTRYQPIEWDLAMLHYCAFLINEKGFLLYRDIFENNLPGVFLFHSLLGKAVGYDAWPLRLVDFSVLALLGSLTWQVLRPLTKPGAIIATCLFIALYLYTGSYVALQRDYLGILPVLAAFCILQAPQLPPFCKPWLVGALCGLACWLKPNCIIAFPLFLYLLYRHPFTGPRSLFTLLLQTGSAFTLIFSIPFIWGLFHADYAAFVEIYKTFTPIYVESRPDLYHYTSSSEKWLDLASKQAAQLKTVLMLSVPGWLWAWLQWQRGSPEHARICDILIVTAVFAFYELMAGKFWLAHLFPSYYWAIVSFSLLFVAPANNSDTWRVASQTGLTLLITGVTLFAVFSSLQQTAAKQYTASNEHVQSYRIARFLKQHLQEGDTVQGIDGSGDGQGALLLARATVASRYLEDIPLYMQPDAPATQAFRQEFITSLQHRKPAFVVYIHNIFHPAGGNRLKEFPALHDWLTTAYRVAEEEEGQYTIYARK